MTNQDVKQKKKHTYFTPTGVIVGLIIIIAVVALLAPAGNYYMRRAQSRVVLQQAKAVVLAANSVAYEQYGRGSGMTDITSDTGFAEGVAEEIKELADCSGTIQLLQWDDQGYKVKKLCYVEGHFVATYELDAQDEMHWDVFSIQSYM